MESYSSLAHAIHNKEVCLILRREKKFDWVVTTAFYASIHQLHYSIFPLSTILAGKIVVFPSFAAYAKHHRDNSSMGKHEILGNAVVESGISPQARKAYEFLKSISFTARYNDYRTSPSIAEQAVSRLGVLEKECEAFRRARLESGS